MASRLRRRFRKNAQRRSNRSTMRGLEHLECRRLLAVTPIHQYSFSSEGSTVLTDSIGGADGELIGAAGQQTGGQLVLDGGSSATASYGDLPNGLISGLTDVTFEGWVTVDGVQSWARLFDFGSTAGGELTGPGGGGEGLDYIMTSAARGGDNNVQRTTIRNKDVIGGGNANGDNEQPVDTGVPTVLGQEFHFAVVFDADGGGPGLASMTYYRDGVAINSRSDIVMQLDNLNDVNNWLGRSNWTADANLQGRFNEFRIYDQPLTAQDITESFSLGPDVKYQPIPLHQYSFSEENSTTLVDSVGGADGELKGAGGQQTGGQLVLGGGASATAAYGDLPNGLISGLSDVTFEGWVTVEGVQSWARLFDFGSTAGGELTGPGGGGEGLDYIMTSAAQGGDNNLQRTTIRNADPVGGGNANGNGEQPVDTSIPTNLNEQFHFAVTFDADGGGVDLASMTYYRNGIAVGSRSDVVIQLANINDVNNWLGRSNWTADANLQGSFNEFRIYDSPLSAEDILLSFNAGPDVSFNPFPQIRDLEGDSLGYQSGVQVIDQDIPASVFDFDTSDFGGGGLTVSVTSNADTSEDVLTVSDAHADVQINGSDIIHTPSDAVTPVASFSGGSGGNDLVITFTTAIPVSVAAASAILQSVAYENTDAANPSGLTRTVVFTISDPENHESSVSATMRINPQPPTAVDDRGATDEDTVLTMVEDTPLTNSLLTNDVDPNNDELFVLSFDKSSALGAEVNVNSDGTFSYDPTSALAIQSLPEGAAATDTFRYAVTDDPNTAVQPIHRWQFNEEGSNLLVDSIGGADGQLLGDGGSQTGGQMVLPGGGSATAAYGDLPNGLISGLTDVTFEGWATVDGNQNWARLFDFGSTVGGELTGPGGGGEGLDYIISSASQGGDSNTQRTTIRNADPFGGGNANGNAEQPVDTGVFTTFGQEFHFAVVFDADGGGNTASLSYYRDGVLAGTRNDVVIQLSNLNDVNNWLGRSNWTADSNMQGRFNEFRLYDQPLNADQVAVSFDRGPDASFSGGPSSATVTIELTGLNDAPLTPDVTETTNEEAGILEVDLGAIVTEVDQGDTATITGLTQNQGLSDRDVSGQFTFQNDILRLDTAFFGDLRDGETQTVVFDYSAIDTLDAVSDGRVTITVEGRDNAPRLENVGFDAPVVEGAVATLSGQAIDPDAGEMLTLQVDWGDGSGLELVSASPGPFSVTHTYVDDDPTGTPQDPYDVTVSVVDYDLANAKQPLHRYSFSGTAGELLVEDTGSDGTAHGAVQGTDGSALTGDGRVDLLGGSSASAGYVDLPNGLVSGLSDATFEGWVSVESAQNWQRFFSFGSTDAGELPGPGGAGGGHDVLMLAASIGTNVDQQRLEVRNADPVGGSGGVFGPVDANDYTFLGAELWYAVVFDADGDNGFPQLRYYRDVNGEPALRATLNTTVQLENLNDVNNWLGRSQWTGDSNLDGKYNEFRVYDEALSESDLQLSYRLGADTDYQSLTPLVADAPLHRYAFDGDAGSRTVEDTGADGTQHGVIQGLDNSGLTGDGQADLLGGSSATAGYVDLPNGLVSGLTDATFEGWVSVESSQNWQRFFSFGSTNVGELTGPGGSGSGYDVLMLSANRGGSVDQQRMQVLNDDPVGGAGGTVGTADADDVTALGQELWYAVVFDADGDFGQPQLRYYREVNGAPLLRGTLPLSVQLENFNDVNNWLGRSQWTGDANLDGKYNEFRIYDQPLGETALQSSFRNGSEVGGGDTSVVSFTETVFNADPVAGDLSAATDENNASAPFGVLTAISDQGTADTHRSVAETVASSQGASATIDASGNAVYDPSGQFDSLPEGATATDTFAYRIMDDDTGTGAGVVTVTITGVNDAPTADAGGPYSLAEGGSVSLNASASSDVDEGDVVTYSWDLNGDGIYGDASGETPSVSWATLISLNPPVDNGPATYNVSVRVSDGLASSDSPSTALNVSNAPPTADVIAPDQAVPNLPVQLTLSASDPSPADQTAGFTYEVNFGDGTPLQTFGPGASGAEVISYAYPSLGFFTLTVTAVDQDGGRSNIASHTLEVVPVAQIGNVIIVGGTDDVNDRIIIQSAGKNAIFVRFNDRRFGRFDVSDASVVRVFAGGGDDRITVANCVATEIYAEEGNDYVAGGQCNDVVHGGPGRDTLLLGEGDNWADGGAGNDHIVGRSGNDVIFGGAGNDSLIGGAGVDQLSGDGGNDRISGGQQDDLLTGGIGNDVLDGGSGDDVLLGREGNDRLIGGFGEDLQVGGGGGDTLKGNQSADRLISGEAENEDDADAMQALLLNWSLNRQSTQLGQLFDDGDVDSLNGSGGPDELLVGVGDIFVQDNADIVIDL